MCSGASVLGAFVVLCQQKKTDGFGVFLRCFFDFI